MTPRRESLAVLLMLALAACACGQAPADDERLLKERGLRTDAASLISFLRQQAHVSETTPVDCEALVAALGDRSFLKREAATQRLIAAGSAVLEKLRAVKTNDAEVRRRLEHCIGAIQAPTDQDAGACAVARLLRLDPPELAATLFAYLPVADGQIVEAIWYGLDAAARDGKLDPAVRMALKDKEPRRRALAAYLLGRYGTDAERKLVPLEDQDEEVRLRAAQGLLGARDRRAVPVLVDLLADAPFEISLQAEELLRWLAGDYAPALDAGTAARGPACVKAWRLWYNDRGKRLDWAELWNAPRRPGLVLAGGEKGLSLYGADGTARWHTRDALDVHDAHVLPGRGVLILGSHSASELRLVGGTLWTAGYWDFGDSIECQRLANGNTIVTTSCGFLELGPTGDTVGQVQVHVKPIVPDPPPPIVFRRGRMVPQQPMPPRPKPNEITILRAVRLRGGLTLALSAEGLAEIDESGMVLRCTPLPGGCTRPNDRFAVFPDGGYCFADNNDMLIAVDPAGKVAWTRPRSGTAIAGLRSGNLLVSYQLNNRLLELDAAGRAVGECFLDVAPRFIHDAFPLLRLGFERPLGDDLDAIANRIKGLTHRELCVRRTAALMLRPDEPCAVRALVAAFDDPDATVRDLVSIALAKAVPRTLPDLLAALDSPGAQIRESAWTALDQAGVAAKAAVPAVVEHLTDPNAEAEDRARAIKWLGAIGPDADAVLPALLKVYATEDAGVRDLIFRSLMKIDGGASAVPHLAASLSDEHRTVESRREDAERLREIVNSLTPLTDAAADKTLPASERITAGQRLWAVRREAVRATGLLAAALRDRSQPEAVRLSVAKTLRALGMDALPVLPVCVDVLSDPLLPAPLSEATKDLLEMGGLAAVEALTELLLVAPPAVRKYAAERLGGLALSGKDAEAALPMLRRAAVEDEDAGVKKEAERAVFRIVHTPPH